VVPLFRAALALVFAALPACGPAAAADTSTGSRATAAAAQKLAEAASAPDCPHPADVLVQVLCNRALRVGLRTYYPGFSVRNDRGEFAGFEVDVARRIADFIGVRLIPVAVDPTTRISSVASGQVDLVIATMGHTTRRDAQVRFIRPHYYLSRTVVVGAKAARVTNWQDLGGRMACLPLGAGSNILFIRHHIPVLTFDQPEQLLDALAFNECAFIVHDDTFFGTLLTDPQWSARFDVKFGFAPMPWGMAVSRAGAEKLAALLTRLSVAFHADGVFLQLARANRLDTTFLQAEQARWSSSACVAEDGTPEPVCLMPPADLSNTRDATAFAPQATWIERSFRGWFGITLGLSLLKDRSSFSLLLQGIGYSLALIVGSQMATTVFALAFGRLMDAGPLPFRRGIGAIAAIGQTTPLPLLLFFGYVIAGGIIQYTGPVALAVAVLVIGFYNGCNAGRAIHEAQQALQRRHEASAREPMHRPTFGNAISLAGVQLIAFLINAAKGSPAAGMIGVPEFLNVMTDLTSYSRDRVAVYLVLLLFYTGLVLLVIVLLYAAQARLARAR